MGLYGQYQSEGLAELKALQQSGVSSLDSLDIPSDNANSCIGALIPVFKQAHAKAKEKKLDGPYCIPELWFRLWDGRLQQKPYASIREEFESETLKPENQLFLIRAVSEILWYASFRERHENALRRLVDWLAPNADIGAGTLQNRFEQFGACVHPTLISLVFQALYQHVIETSLTGGDAEEKQRGRFILNALENGVGFGFITHDFATNPAHFYALQTPLYDYFFPKNDPQGKKTAERLQQLVDLAFRPLGEITDDHIEHPNASPDFSFYLQILKNMRDVVQIRHPFPSQLDAFNQLLKFNGLEKIKAPELGAASQDVAEVVVAVSSYGPASMENVSLAEPVETGAVLKQRENTRIYFEQLEKQHCNIQQMVHILTNQKAPGSYLLFGDMQTQAINSLIQAMMAAEQNCNDLLAVNHPLNELLEDLWELSGKEGRFQASRILFLVLDQLEKSRQSMIEAARTINERLQTRIVTSMMENRFYRHKLLIKLNRERLRKTISISDKKTLQKSNHLPFSGNVIVLDAVQKAYDRETLLRGFFTRIILSVLNRLTGWLTRAPEPVSDGVCEYAKGRLAFVKLEQTSKAKDAKFVQVQQEHRRIQAALQEQRAELTRLSTGTAPQAAAGPALRRPLPTPPVEQQQTAALRHELEDKTGQIATLEAQIQQLQHAAEHEQETAAAEHTAKMALQQREVDALRGQVAQLTKDLATVTQEKETEQAQLQVAHQTGLDTLKGTYEATVAQLKSERDALSTEHHTLQQTAALTQEALDTAQAELERIRPQISTQQTCIQKLELELVEKDRVHDATILQMSQTHSADTDPMKEHLASLENQLKTIRSENHQLTESLSRSETDKAAVDQQLIEMREKDERLQSEKDALRNQLKTKVEEHEAQVEKIQREHQQELVRLQSTLADVQGKLVSHLEIHAQLQREYQALIKQKAKDDETINRYAAVNARLEIKVKEQKETLDAATARNEKLEKNFSDSTNQLARLTAEKEQSEEKVQALEAQKEKLEQAGQVLKVEKEKLEESIREKTQTLSEKQDELQKTQQALKEAQAQAALASDFEKKADKFAQDNVVLCQRQRALEIDVATLKKFLDEKKSEYDALNIKHGKLYEYVTSLQQQIAPIQKENMRLKEEVSTLKKQLDDLKRATVPPSSPAASIQPYYRGETPSVLSQEGATSSRVINLPSGAAAADTPSNANGSLTAATPSTQAATPSTQASTPPDTLDATAVRTTTQVLRTLPQDAPLGFVFTGATAARVPTIHSPTRPQSYRDAALQNLSGALTAVSPARATRNSICADGRNLTVPSPAVAPIDAGPVQAVSSSAGGNQRVQTIVPGLTFFSFSPGAGSAAAANTAVVHTTHDDASSSAASTSSSKAASTPPDSPTNASLH